MPAYINSNKFTYDKAKALFSAEASDLQLRNMGSFYIKSNRTGDTRLFLLQRVEKDAGGEDVLAFHYISPGQGLSAVVFND
jgi:hypothetical protein